MCTVKLWEWQIQLLLALAYLSVHCSVTLGLPKLNNMQRGAKLKHLGQEKKNSTRDVSS